MKAYIVTYEISEISLNDYKSLYDEIKASKHWWHHIANSWIIKTDESALEINDRLKPHLDDDINLIVFELGKERAGWLPKKSWEWITRNIPKR